MTNTHSPALYCTRCAFRPATRHIDVARVCDKCVTPAEWLEIETWPRNVHEQEVEHAS